MIALLADSTMTITASQAAMLLAGVAIIFSISRWRMNTVRRRNSESPPPAREAIAPPSRTSPSPLTVREVTTEIQALLTDVEETARRVAAQIDNRRVRIEQLMTDADEKIQRLEALLKQPAPLTPQIPSAFPSTSANARIDATHTLSRLRQERGAPPAKEDPAYQPVYHLADLGKSPREIGQALNRQPGEIELILALRNRQPA